MLANINLLTNIICHDVTTVHYLTYNTYVISYINKRKMFICLSVGDDYRNLPQLESQMKIDDDRSECT